jgi:hypothetical protein
LADEGVNRVMLLLIRWKLFAPVILLLALVLSACDSFNGGAEMSDLETRSAQLQGTIDAVGTPGQTIAALQMTADRGMGLQAELSNLQGTVIAFQGNGTLNQGGNNLPQPTPGSVNVDPAGPNLATAPTPNPSQTSFSQTTMSTGIRDEDGCASGPTTVFDAAETEIFVVTTISNLKAGSTFSARWLANGSLFEDQTCWVPAEDWATVCAYCSIVPDAATFEGGSWSVELLLDGQLMSQAQFQVAGPVQVDDYADDYADDYTGDYAGGNDYSGGNDYTGGSDYADEYPDG